jgi:hypothetical protein
MYFTKFLNYTWPYNTRNKRPHRLGDDKVTLEVQIEQQNDVYHPPFFPSRPTGGMAVDLPDMILFFMEFQITMSNLFCVY